MSIGFYCIVLFPLSLILITLFSHPSPCVQSPLKTKVEAFERHAKDAIAPHTPASQPRTTRNTGKALIDGPGGAGGSRSLLRQPSTPKVADLYRHVKPFTPVGQHQPPGGQPSGYYSSQETSRIPSTSSSVASTNSTSKLAHLNRPASASKVGQMRDSAEDIRKGLQEQADEKKRKREEKLKQVQTMREAREKEKIDKLKKQMQVRHLGLSLLNEHTCLTPWRFCRKRRRRFARRPKRNGC